MSCFCHVSNLYAQLLVLLSVFLLQLQALQLMDIGKQKVKLVGGRDCNDGNYHIHYYSSESR